LKDSALRSSLSKTLEELQVDRLIETLGRTPALRPTYVRGKVRDILTLGEHLLIVTTDRISAFDRVLTTIPCKGEVLNRISLFWFEETKDIVPNHLVEALSSRSALVRRCKVLPVEVVVRGYLTGSAWRAYRDGKSVSGIRFEPGMVKDQGFERPIITPSTKEERGEHDRPISREEILSEGLVSEALWEKVERIALALFARGSELVARQGLILVDTKYEFGLHGDELTLVDEIHTPDSSRFWYADGYDERLSQGENQRELDKEYLRRWLLERGYQGDGRAPEIPDEIRVEVAKRYITAFELITGQSFAPSGLSGSEELRLLTEKLKDL
jgi:phosphoribosylaminoimidazole-succinocarboxamide synthase